MKNDYHQSKIFCKVKKYKSNPKDFFQWGINYFHPSYTICLTAEKSDFLIIYTCTFVLFRNYLKAWAIKIITANINFLFTNSWQLLILILCLHLLYIMKSNELKHWGKNVTCTDLISCLTLVCDQVPLLIIYAKLY